MELISQRVAVGLPVQPNLPKRRKRDKFTVFTSQSRIDLAGVGAAANEQTGASASQENLNRLVGHFVTAKTWTGGVMEVLKDGRVGLKPLYILILIFMSQ